ncbi:restriction endonuclease subunit S [Kocuria rhizophila]|uniref:restriction endonuclease subunit S n=1 Tax=Kocuria rhizophila TaxID=72000 RepID=UPI003879046B
MRQTDIVEGRVDWTSVPYCDLDTESVERYSLNQGDLLISRLGNGVGNAVTVMEDRADAVFAGYLVRFQPDPAVADARFVGYQLQSLRWREHVLSYRSGAAQPTLNAKQMGQFTFPLPALEDQRAIAATLGALDDKIESNRRLIELVPGLVRAHGDLAITDESVAVPVSDLATFTNGGAYTKAATRTGRMVIRIAELNSGPGGSTVYNDIEVPDNKTARAGDILMAWSGSLGVYRWYRDEAIINQHIFKVDPDGYPAWLVFDRLEAVMPVFRALAADKATTMGHIQRGHLTSTTASLPTTAAIARLDEEIAPLWERLLLAERENLRLSRLRDALLPELLSGRLRTPAEAS